MPSSLAVDDATAALLDLDGWSREHADRLLTGLTPDQWAEVDRLRHELRALLFGLGWPPPRPADPPVAPPAPDVLISGYLLFAPEVAEFHAGRGIPAAVSAASLADIGRHLRLHRSHTGEFGLDSLLWPTAALSGTLLQLGRLQFMLRRLGGTEPLPPGSDGMVLDVHIPASGPLTRAAVADSFDQARTAFPTYFPEHPAAQAICSSWLLDPALADGLGPDSNISAFAGLFRAYAVADPDSRDALYFTFGTRDTPLEDLPRDTSLQRLVIDRLRAGGSWQVVRGVREM